MMRQGYCYRPTFFFPRRWPCRRSRISYRATFLQVLSLSLLTLGASCLSPSAIHLRVVHFNDVYKLCHLSKFQGYVNSLRQQDTSSSSKTICTLGGDFFSPSLLSSMDQGEAMTACLSPIVEYACLGNHEADVGPAAFIKNVDNFHATIVNSNFPVLPPTTKDMPSHVTIKLSSADETNQKSVALLGLLENSPNLYLPNAFGKGAIEAAEPIKDCLKRMSKELFQKDISMILPLTHQDVPDDIALAEEFGCPQRMPLVLGGHDHEVYDESILNADNNSIHTTKCRVLKAGMDAERAIVIDLTWQDSKTKCPTVTVEFVNVAQLDDSYIDPQVQTLVNHYEAPLARLDRTVLRLIEQRSFPLSSVNVRKQQTTVGSLICTALRKALSADIAVLNSGCIRGNTEYTENEDYTGDCKFFTFADLLNELPYATEVASISLPGHVLEAAIDYSRQGNSQGGGFLQCCNKLEVSKDDNNGDDGGSWKITQVRGEPFDPNKIYRVALTHNLLRGMDNIRPLVEFAQSHGDQIPPVDATRPAKELVLQVYHREIWLALGSFDEIDTDESEYISKEELRRAVAKAFGIDPSDELVSDTLNVFDVNDDGIVTRQEYNACIRAIESNRFDLDLSACMEDWCAFR